MTARIPWPGRLVYVLPYLGIGGTEYHVLHLVRAIAWREPPRVVAPDGPLRPEFVAAGARMHFFDDLTGNWWVGMRTFRRALGEALAEGSGAAAPEAGTRASSIVHVHGAAELLWLAYRQARRQKAPARFLFTSHGYFGPGARTSYRLAAWILRRLRVPVIAVSQEEARRLQQAGLPPGQLRVVHNGVPDPLQQPAPAWPFGDGRPRVLFVGRLAEQKGVRQLLEAFEQVSPVAPGARLVIVGAGPLEAELRERIGRSESLRTRVELAGPVPGAARLMAHADVVCMPSLDEALSLVGIEALACGRALVASRAGGTGELIEDGTSGVLVPPGDVTALARALGARAGRPRPSRTPREGARRRYETAFTVEAMAAKTAAIYAGSESRPGDDRAWR
ncbi:MAG: glycosyltransferase family 4 protein [Limnochordaceae bacterium]|nr:glycosyltransferase family 4 protein [Limnochordaceae bacterium]